MRFILGRGALAGLAAGTAGFRNASSVPCFRISLLPKATQASRPFMVAVQGSKPYWTAAGFFRNASSVPCSRVSLL